MKLSSCDIGNPIYENEPKPETGSDTIDVPVFDQDGDVIFKEPVYFEWEQYGRDVKVRVKFQHAFPDDVYDAIRMNFKTYNVEFI